MREFLKDIATKPFAKISGRPSKTYFYSKFLRDIQDYSDVELAADIASARFDNAGWFNSTHYVGVDFDRDRLSRGRVRYDRSHVGIQADIRDKIFQTESFDLIACSHTLSHLDRSEHVSMVGRLIEYLKSDGSLFIQFHDGAFTPKISNFLNNSFENVTTLRYNNVLSQMFERVNEGDTGRIDVNMTGLSKFVNGSVIILLALLESLPLPRRKYTYARCLGKC